MAGSLFGLGLSQQFGPDGRVASGALLYIYEANTSTPAVTYADFALASAQTWPLEADSVGRIPAFWVDDGAYRARLTTSTGVEIFDEQSITSIGASSGDAGGSVAADTSTLFQTGDLLWLPIAGTRSGWVRGNGRTIGSGASGSAERANGDTQALFEYFWNNFSDSFCAVSGGRGANAAADFNADKTIATLDMRSRGIFGLGDMGNTALGITGESTIAATAIGASTYTVATANLPSTNLSIASLTITNGTNLVQVVSGQSFQSVDGGAGTHADAFSISHNPTTVALAAGGSIPLGGSGTDLDILPPLRVGTFYFKL
jgi:hypothetical protein